MSDEFRAIAVEDMELRKTSDGKPEIRMKIPYNKLSFDMGGFRERILPGAFAESIKKPTISYWNHNRDMVLGSTENGTMSFEDSKSGLIVRVFPPDTTYAKDAITAIEGGYVRGASFRFNTAIDEWDHRKRPSLRTIKEMTAPEFSPCAEPAFPQTKISVRSMLTGAGIDFDGVSRIVEARSAGLEIAAEDQEIIVRAIGALTEMLPVEDSDSGQEDGTANAEQLKRKRAIELELSE